MKHFVDNHMMLSAAFTSALCVLVLSLVLEYAFAPNPLVGLLHGIRQGFYTLIASVSASLLGFSLATLSITIAFMQSPRLKIVRESKHYPSLYGIFLTAIKLLAVGTIVSVICLLFDTDRSPQAWLTYLCLWSILLSLSAVFRCIWAMGKIVSIVSKPLDRG